VIDLRERAALDIVKAVYADERDHLPNRAAALDSTPSGRVVRLLIWGIAAAAVVESALPSAVPRSGQRVSTS
jgi:hypothetical protein